MKSPGRKGHLPSPLANYTTCTREHRPSARPSLSHTSDQGRAVRANRFFTLLGCASIPFGGFGTIYYYKKVFVAIEIGCPNNVLDKNVAAVGGAAIPLPSQNWILRYAYAEVIFVSDLTLGFNIALFC